MRLARLSIAASRSVFGWVEGRSDGQGGVFEGILFLDVPSGEGWCFLGPKIKWNSSEGPHGQQKMPTNYEKA